MKKVRKAVIPVGGMGTRFLPVTKVVPKEMLPIIDIPTLQYIIEEATASGIEEILLINSYGKQAVESYFMPNQYLEERLTKDGKIEDLKKLQEIDHLATIYFVYQDKPHGNGQAMMLAEEFVKNEPFAVMWGDDLIKSEVPVLKQLIDVYEKYDSNVVGVQKVDHDQVSRYGIVSIVDEETGKMDRIVEKPPISEAPSDYAGLGRYIVKPEIFQELKNLYQEKGEYYFTDALANLIQYQDCYACKFEGTYYDIGHQLGYIIANIEYGLDRPDIKKGLEEYLKNKKNNLVEKK